MERLDTYLNGLESSGYLDSVTYEKGVYTLSQGVKWLQMMKEGDALLIRSSRNPSELKMVEGDEVWRVLPTVITSSFTGVKKSHTFNGETFRNVSIFPVGITSGASPALVFEDATGRQFVASECVPSLTYSFYKQLQTGRGESCIMMLPQFRSRVNETIDTVATPLPPDPGLDKRAPGVALRASFDRMLPHWDEYLSAPKPQAILCSGVTMFANRPFPAAFKEGLARMNQSLDLFSGISGASAPVIKGEGDVPDTPATPIPSDPGLDDKKPGEQTPINSDMGGSFQPTPVQQKAMEERKAQLVQQGVDEATADELVAEWIQSLGLGNGDLSQDSGMAPGMGPSGGETLTSADDLAADPFFASDDQDEFVDSCVDGEDKFLEQCGEKALTACGATDEFVKNCGDEVKASFGLQYLRTGKVSIPSRYSRFKNLSMEDFGDGFYVLSHASAIGLRVNTDGRLVISSTATFKDGTSHYGDWVGAAPVEFIIPMIGSSGYHAQDLFSGVTLDRTCPEFHNLKKLLLSRFQGKSIPAPVLSSALTCGVKRGKDVDAILSRFGLKNPSGVFQAITVLTSSLS